MESHDLEKVERHIVCHSSNCAARSEDDCRLGHQLSNVQCSDSASESATNTTPSNASTNSTPKGPCYIPAPFNAIKDGTWLHNRTEKHVFTLLVDVYRLRVEDQYKFEGEVDEGSLYSGASPASALRCFQRFLTKATKLDAKRSKKLLPDWWSQDKLKACVAFAKSDDWANVGYAVEKHDVQEHCEQNLMPMQLRMFGEKLDGTMTAGASGSAMLQIQTMAKGGGMMTSHLSLN